MVSPRHETWGIFRWIWVRQPPTNTDPASADHDASTAPAALPGVATAAPQAATTATVGSSKRQMTMAESFRRTTRRRTDDPGDAARPLTDASPTAPVTAADHPDPLPPPEPPPAEMQRPHRPLAPRPDTTQQRTDQSRAHPQVHDDGPGVAATMTDEATGAAEQPRVAPHPPPHPRHPPATASDSDEDDRTGATAGARTTRQRKRKRPTEDPPFPLPPTPRATPGRRPLGRKQRNRTPARRGRPLRPPPGTRTLV